MAFSLSELFVLLDLDVNVTLSALPTIDEVATAFGAPIPRIGTDIQELLPFRAGLVHLSRPPRALLHVTPIHADLNINGFWDHDSFNHLYGWARAYIKDTSRRAPHGVARPGYVGGVSEGLILELGAVEHAHFTVTVRREEHPLETLLTVFGLRGADLTPPSPGWHAVPTPLPIRLEMSARDSMFALRWTVPTTEQGTTSEPWISHWFSAWIAHIGTGSGMGRADGSGDDWPVRGMGSVFEPSLHWDMNRVVKEIHVPASWWTDVRRLRDNNRSAR